MYNSSLNVLILTHTRHYLIQRALIILIIFCENCVMLFSTGPGVQLRRRHRREVDGQDLRRPDQVRRVGLLRRIQSTRGTNVVRSFDADSTHSGFVLLHLNDIYMLQWR